MLFDLYALLIVVTITGAITGAIVGVTTLLYADATTLPRKV